MDKINSLYCEYASLLGKDNVENALQTLKGKIILEVYSIFCEGGHSRKKIENSKYSLELIEAVSDCLSYFKSDSERDFAPYVISAVDKKISLAKTNARIKESNSMYVPRDKNVVIRNIRKEEEHLMWIRNPERRKEQIRLNLGLSENEFKALYPLAVSSEASLDVQISEDSDTSLGDMQAADIPSAESLLEAKEDFDAFMIQVQKKWGKSKDKEILSDALTVDILGRMFESTTSSVKLGEESAEYEDKLGKYPFVNREILHRFFSDATYRLPTQEKIGLKYGGMTKGGVSRKVSRFYESFL